MNTTEHLLTTAAEEAAETALAICKALRFGLDDQHPKTGNIPNRELIAREFEDLCGVMHMLQKREVVRPPTHLGIIAKRARVHEFLDYAKRVGAVTDFAPEDHRDPVGSNKQTHKPRRPRAPRRNGRHSTV